MDKDSAGFLEAHLKPGHCSEKGFLGESESLEAVIAQDRKTLSELGVTHEQIASAIEDLLGQAERLKETLSGEEIHKKRTEFPDLYHPESLPYFSRENLPSPDQGFCLGHYQVFMLQYRGLQECPWDCPGASGDYDFMILDRWTGLSFTGPSLIPHLIRHHFFFEGRQSPYRVDPEKASLILGLIRESNQ